MRLGVIAGMSGAGATDGVDVAQDDGQDVVEIVRDAASQRSHRLAQCRRRCGALAQQQGGASGLHCCPGSMLLLELALRRQGTFAVMPE